MTEVRETRLKRLRLRCWRRGTKEMDLLFGKFADDGLADLITRLGNRVGLEHILRFSKVVQQHAPSAPRDLPQCQFELQVVCPVVIPQPALCHVFNSV